MAFPAAAGGHLSDRFCVARRTNHGIDRRSWHLAAGRVSGRCFQGARGARLLDHAHDFLAGAWRLVSQSGYDCGRGDGDRAAVRDAEGRLGAAAADLFVRAVSVAVHRGPGFSVLPVGLAAARNRISGDLSRELQIDRAAVSLAAVPPDVSLRRGEADQPRSGVARFHRARLITT